MDAPATLTPTPPMDRRHDLDALRGFAMLLGIALHAALAYAPIPWVVQDSQQSSLFRYLFEIIHGFRMPLFFIVSGFFTAMLWRKRGLRSLLKQRAHRIGLPLLISIFTIIPLTFAASLTGMFASGHWGREAVDAKASLVAAIRLGDSTEIANHLQAGSNPNQPDPSFGATPLSWATLLGDAQAVQLLLDSGADINRPNGDGATPLMSAVFVGKPELVQLLIDRGANPTVENNTGARPTDILQADRGTTELIGALLKLNLDWNDVQTGRKQAGPLLEKAEQAWSEQNLTENPPQDPSNNQISAATVSNKVTGFDGWLDAYRRWLRTGIVGGLVYIPFFQHLWFLWFLCWFVCIFACYAAISDATHWSGLPNWLVISPLRILWILPLTFIPQLFMSVDVPTFGPSTSIGLLPHPHLLFYYGVFFAFGAFYFDSKDEAGVLGRWWILSLSLALFVAYPLALNYAENIWLTSAAQVVYVWAMSIGMMGLFRKFVSAENPKIRYLSDSSYWLYLAHMPLIFLAQTVALTLSIPAWAKFSIVCAGVTGLLLICYQYLIRYTFIGRMLNGQRVRA